MAGRDKENGMSVPIAGMWFTAILSAVVVGASFAVIPYWPQPPSVAPYYTWEVGAFWGLVVGGITGLVIGYLTDDRHFGDSQY